MDIEDGRLVSLIGDKDNPAYHGFTCKKGRELPAHLYHPNRLLAPLRRRFESGQSVDSAGEADRAERDDKGTGKFERISREGAISEIAQRLSTIIDRHL
jgi:anaerobic selenocysteine-containing dehydrogenase